MSTLIKNKSRLLIVVLVFLLIISSVLNLYLVSSFNNSQKSNMAQTVGYFDENNMEKKEKTEDFNSRKNLAIPVVSKIPPLEGIENNGSNEVENLSGDWNSMDKIDQLYAVITNPSEYMEEIKSLVREEAKDWSQGKIVQRAMIKLAVELISEDMQFDDDSERLSFEEDLLSKLDIELNSKSEAVYAYIKGATENAKVDAMSVELDFGETKQIDESVSIVINDVSKVLDDPNIKDDSKRFVKYMSFFVFINEAVHYITERDIHLFDYVSISEDESSYVIGEDYYSYMDQNNQEVYLIGVQGASLLGLKSDSYEVLDGISTASSVSTALLYKDELEKNNSRKLYNSSGLPFYVNDENFEEFRYQLQFVLLLSLLSKNAETRFKLGKPVVTESLLDKDVFELIEDEKYADVVHIKDRTEMFSYIKSIRNAVNLDEILGIFTEDANQKNLRSVYQFFTSTRVMKLGYEYNLSREEILGVILEYYIVQMSDSI